MPLPCQRAHIVGEDEILKIARRAELHARHDVVELDAQFRETRLADQHDGAIADQVGDDFARDLRHRGLLLLLACTSASLTASRLRNTATGWPTFNIARANSSPVAPRHESPVVMWSKSGGFSG